MENTQTKREYPCDQCRRRKVRCNYLSPCDRCQSYGLACTSRAIRKKPGRKPGSGAVPEHSQKEMSLNNEHPEIAMPAPSTAHKDLLSMSEDAPEAQDRLPATLRPDVVLAAGSQFADSHQPRSTHLRSVGESSAPALWTSDLASTGYILPNDGFYTFDDFAQTMLNPSTNTWHSNLSAARETEWSPFDHTDDQEATVSVMSHTGVSTNTPHTISAVVAETAESPQASASESNDIIARCVDLFFQHMYPTYPILIESRVRSWLSNAPPPEQSDTCMLWALCAATLVHVDSWPNLTFERRMRMARSYITLCTGTRLNGTFPESPSFADVLCSLFVAIAYFELRCRIASWIYVREAVTLAIASGLHNAATNTSLTNEERVQQQRCYALLFVTERGASILDNFPVSIMSIPTLSQSVLPNETPATGLGGQRLYELLSLIERKFVRVWNELPPSSSENYGYPEFAHLQERLRQPIDLRGVSDIQRADILVTQQWLRLVFWQAELRMGLISTTSADSAFSYEFPMEIASSLCDIVKSLPPVAIEVHGLGIVVFPADPIIQRTS